MTETIDKEEMIEEQAPSPEEVLIKMKENYVPKEEAENWHQKYNNLFAQFANGGTFEQKEEPQIDLAKQALDEIHEIQSKKSGSVKHIKALLDWDNSRRASGMRSIFVNSSGEVTEETQQTADAINDIFARTLELANGDSSVASTYLVSQMDGFSLAPKK